MYDVWPIKRYSGFRNWYPVGDYECSQFDDPGKRKVNANFKCVHNSSALFIRYSNWKQILECTDPKVTQSFIDKIG
jgi:hypothetical protein